MDGSDWAGVIVTVAVGLIGVLLPLLLRLGAIQKENHDAHEKIGKNIDRVESSLSSRIDRIDRRDRRRALAAVSALED